MAFLNNIYANAAFNGFYAGMLAGRTYKSGAVLGDFASLKTAALAMAADVDALIAESALVSTGGGDPSQLAITTNTIAANEQHRAQLLHDLCFGAAMGRYTENATVAGGQTVQAAGIVAAWNQGITGLTTP